MTFLLGSALKNDDTTINSNLVTPLAFTVVGYCLLKVSSLFLKLRVYVLCVLRVLAYAVLTRVLYIVVANINLSLCWFYLIVILNNSSQLPRLKGRYQQCY